LQQAKEQYRRLFEDTGDSIFIIDPKTLQILDVNGNAARRLKYSREELLKLKLNDIEARLVEDTPTTPMWESMFSGTQLYECQHRRKDGTLTPVEVSTRLARFGDKDVLQNIVRDISARKRMEKALRVSEERLKLALDAATDSLFDWNMKTGQQYFSPRYYTLVGYTPAEMPAWKDLLHPDDKARVLAATQEIFQQKTDGSVLEYRLVTKTGEVRWVLSRSKVTERDENGKPIRLVGTHVDITERKRAEAERERLIADLDAYAHTVAHDLKNPLNITLGYASMLVAGFEGIAPDEAKSYLQEIKRGSQKMSNIIDALLLLASVRKLDDVGTKLVDMATIVSEALARLKLMVKEHEAEIVVPEAGKWPKAFGYAPWIEEVWANYISNAIKYGGTPPRVELGATESGNNMVRYWVRDNGPGISVEQQAQLFDQFTRFGKTDSQGHGLGLSIVKRIVEKLGGQVAVESSPDQGCTFSFTLPTVKKEDKSEEQIGASLPDHQ
jgi:PAS domain S-box-containing protein